MGNYLPLRCGDVDRFLPQLTIAREEAQNFTYLDINSEHSFNRAVFPGNGRGERDARFVRGEEDVGLGPGAPAPFNRGAIPSTCSRVIGVRGIALTFDDSVVGTPPRQPDLAAMGAIPYYLSAGAVVDLLVTARDVKELACRIAN